MAYGYDRDGQKGKKQNGHRLVVRRAGRAGFQRSVSRQHATFASQVKKASQRFAGERVTLVGDRGMIQSGQIEDLSKTGFHYITAITKPQIETLLQTGLLQMAWFDDTLCEVEHDRVRYILRRNPRRAEELVASRADKQASVETLRQQLNRYLSEHPRAKVATAQKAVRAKIVKLRLEPWLQMELVSRTLLEPTKGN